MSFNRVAGLPGGWEVGYRVSPSIHLLFPEMPYFRRSDGRLMTPAEVATSDSGREVFHYVKRWLDLADKRLGRDAGMEPSFRAVDKAKYAMHLALVEIGSMSDDLLRNDVSLGH